MALQNYRERVIRSHIIWKCTHEQLSEYLLKVGYCGLESKLSPRSSLEKQESVEYKIVFSNGATGFILSKENDIYLIKLRGYSNELKNEMQADLADICREILDRKFYIGIIFSHEETGDYDECYQSAN
jgi:hypothetical protein